METKAANVIMGENDYYSTDFPETDFAILAVCGPTESKCSSLNVLNDSDGVNVVPILSFPEIAKDFAEDILQKTKAWEATAFKALVEIGFL
mmetsp:Transcript_23051/g.34156  ORF Transcript_23051/g.34156 Transcript_23051/m.34156 type:complete len:91 (+) Transcript_23051:126-398(+)